MWRIFLLAALLSVSITTASVNAEEKPLTLTASTSGDFAEGDSWYLSMNSAGQAELTIQAYPDAIRRQFVVSPQQRAALCETIESESFFDLAEEYGELVPDGSTQTLTITLGEHTRSIKVYYLMNWVDPTDREKLEEPDRALRILILTREWFVDPEAVNLSPYNQIVIDAVEPPPS